MDADKLLQFDSWLDVIAGFEHCGIPEKLLDELLSDTSESSQPSPCNSARQNDSLSSKASQKKPRKPTSEPVDANAMQQMALRTVPRHARLRHEIARLKKTVMELDTMLGLLRQRQDTIHMTHNTDQQGVGSDCSDAVTVDAWKGVATRQHERLRDATVENRVLRSQVEAQLAIMHDLQRLVDRAQATGQLASPTSPSSVADLQHAAFAKKRSELFVQAAAALDAVDRVVTDEQFSTRSDEFCTVFASNNRLLEPGDVMVDSRARHIVPLSMGDVGAAVWGPSSNSRARQAPGNCVLLHEMEEASYQQVRVYSMELPRRDGPVRVTLVAVRCRKRVDGRDVLVTVASPLVLPNFEVKICAVTQPYIGSTSLPPSQVSEVLIRMETLQGASSVDRWESLQLREWAATMHAYLHDDIQRRTDSLLLGQSDEPRCNQ